MTIATDLSDDRALVSISSGVYGIFHTVVNRKNLCKLGSVRRLIDDDDDDSNYKNNNNSSSSKSNIDDDDEGSSAWSYYSPYSSTACPSIGSYRIRKYFTVAAPSQDRELQYTPDLKVDIYRQSDNELIGCVETGTPATTNVAARHSKHGEIALSVAVALFVVCFGVLLYLSYRRKKRLEKSVTDRQYHYYSSNGQTHVAAFDQGRIRRERREKALLEQQEPHHHHHQQEHDHQQHLEQRE